MNSNIGETLKLGHNCTLSRLCFCFPHCLAGTRKQARAASLAPRARGNWHANSQLAARRRRPRGRSSLIGLDKKTTWIVLSSQVCSRGSTPPAGCSLRCSVVITGFSARASTSMFEGQPLRASSWRRGGGAVMFPFFAFPELQVIYLQSNATELDMYDVYYRRVANWGGGIDTTG